MQADSAPWFSMATQNMRRYAMQAEYPLVFPNSNDTIGVRHHLGRMYRGVKSSRPISGDERCGSRRGASALPWRSNSEATWLSCF